MLGKTKVKYIQSLGHKKGRDAEGVFLAEGPKIVGELLAADLLQVEQVYATRSWLDQQGAWPEKIACTEVSEEELARISQLATPNQVLAIVKKRTVTSFDPHHSVSLALDTIQDPGNLGTLIRIADWFGIRQIVCSSDCADSYNPKVVQSTMGSIARVSVLYTNLAEWLAAQKGIRVYAAALEGQDVTAMSRIGEGIIVIGNESRGISPAVLEQVNVRITIPGKGSAESLNAAVAAGIILSHLT